MPYLGEILSLTTAALWAVAVILFKKGGETVHPIALNLFKNALAALLFLPTFWLVGETPLPGFPARDYLLMLAGGVVGVALADTIFFLSLNMLGASLVAIVDCLYAPFMIFFAILFLGESLSAVKVTGAVLIVLAVLAPLFEREKVSIERRRLLVGALLGALSMLLMALSIVVVKPLLDKAPLLWAANVRMLGGVAGVLVLLAFIPGRRRILGSLSGKGLRYTIPGAFVGGYLCLVLWLAGMKYAHVSVASALNQTSNIFLFLLAAVVLKELITPQRITGIVAGVAGALLVTFG